MAYILECISIRYDLLRTVHSPAVLTKTIRTDNRIRAQDHFIEEFFVKFENTLNPVDTNIHGKQDWNHQYHGDPNSQQALEASSTHIIGINTEDPSVAHTVKHYHENAQSRGQGRTGPCLGKVPLIVYVEEWRDVDQGENEEHNID